MKQLLPSLVLLCLATFTFADDCNNPLLSVFGFGTGQLQSGSGLNYCKSLKSGNSCCSASIVNTIQDKANALATRLVASVVLRDRAIVDGRNALPQLQANVQQITQLMPTLISQISQNNSPLMTVLNQIASQSGTSVSESAEQMETGIEELITMIITPLQGVVTTMINNVDALTSNFQSYQKSRSTCAVELIKLQASAWCLACDPAYASKGVSGTTITMSGGVCSRLQTACYNYISSSTAQGQLVADQTASTTISTMVTMLQKLVNGDISGYADFATITASQSSGSGQSGALASNSLPDGCTADGQCSWICSSLFNNGVVDETLAVIGGQQGSNSRRVLIEEGSVVQSKLQDKRRALESYQWNPDDDEAGVQVTFPDDPANVGGSSGSSGLLVRISLMSLMGFLIAIML